MPPLLLDDDEAVAIAVSLRTTTGAPSRVWRDGVARADQVAAGVADPAGPTRRRPAVTHRPGVRSATRPAVDGRLLALIAATARDREVMRFRYSDHAGTASERRVEPYRLVNWGHRWYLVAFDVERDDWRTFRVDRLDDRALGRAPVHGAAAAR